MNFQEFLDKTDWKDCIPQWFSADWSSRRYGRLTNGRGRSAIMLDSPPDDHPDSVIGHKLGEWIRLNRHFSRFNLNVPEIYAEDARNGFVLMEDFGNESLAGKGREEYEIAVDVLVSMRDAVGALETGLLAYEDTHVRKALRFYPEHILRQGGLEQEWLAAWEGVESTLPACPRALTHIDFFCNNLMWLPDRSGTDRIGILDFQAACDGPFVYDIVNLLDDARRDLPDSLKKACMARYCDGLTSSQRAVFDAWYPVMAAQFHARVLGQIVKLGREKNRTDLMVFYDPLFVRFEKELQHPALRPILDFINDYKK